MAPAGVSQPPSLPGPRASACTPPHPPSPHPRASRPVLPTSQAPTHVREAVPHYIAPIRVSRRPSREGPARGPSTPGPGRARIAHSLGGRPRTSPALCALAMSLPPQLGPALSRARASPVCIFTEGAAYSIPSYPTCVRPRNPGRNACASLCAGTSTTAHAPASQQYDCLALSTRPPALSAGSRRRGRPDYCQRGLRPTHSAALAAAEGSRQSAVN